MKQHLKHNPGDPRRATLVEAAVAREDRRVWVEIGPRADW
jgi:hypothetical protein